jgi:hypothetical protein
MFQFSSLAQAIYDEAVALATRTTYDNDRSMSPEERFNRCRSFCPLPEVAQFEAVVEELFWASLLSEEGRLCQPRLLFRPSGFWPFHEFTTHLPLKRDVLRKLTPAHAGGYLGWDLVEGIPKLLGIVPKIYPIEPSNRFLLTTSRPGAMVATWSGIRVVFLRGGQILRLSESLLIDPFGALVRIGNLLGDDKVIHLWKTLETALALGHGGSFWILKAGSACPSGISIGRKLSPQQFNLIDNQQNQEQRFAWLDSIAHLAAVPGP